MGGDDIGVADPGRLRGDRAVPGGQTYEIIADAVAGATSTTLTLDRPYAGPTSTAAPIRIKPLFSSDADAASFLAATLVGYIDSIGKLLRTAGNSREIVLRRQTADALAGITLGTGDGEEWRIGMYGTDRLRIQRTTNNGATYSDVMSFSLSDGTVSLSANLALGTSPALDAAVAAAAASANAAAASKASVDAKVAAFTATVTTSNNSNAVVQLASEIRRIVAATAVGGAVGVEPDLVISPMAGVYWARDLGVPSGDLAAWATGMGGAFTRASSGTYFGPNGTMLTAANNVPRIEYDQYSGDKLGLLIEPGSTNLALRSTDISVTPWGVGANATISGTTVTAPDGSTAKVLVMNASANAFVSQGGIAGTNGTTYTMPAWLQLVAGGDTLTTNSMALYLRDAGGATTSAFTPAAFTLTKGIWKRVWVAAKTLADGTLTIVPIFDRSGYSIAIWGAGLEPRASPTSDILTAGTSAARAADLLSVPLLEPSLFSARTGAFFVEVSMPFAPSGTSSTQLDVGVQRGGSWNNPGYLARIRGQSGLVYAQQIALGASGEMGRSEEVTIATGTVVRMAATWSSSGLRWAINGRAPTGIATAPSASSAPAALIVAPLAAAYARRVIVTRQALSDAQLQALSALTW
ncbi:phage head spike fiber domain-containing protein [Segnochrobactrum spirostomi]|uniref:Uncharacterized protein n=1 Tax=Segnochrobactrum spirostomi TaxID=2608987 RepID=A0A6A7Y6C2_9HYPH|nr:hypothetical protein [Segnochrobactrum spirostomi]MQT13631.1 hypothetical protein [Segnochrobactrum spirostomi]